MKDKREFSRRADRIEELVRRLESCGDPAMRAVASELLQSVIELHGVALERMLDTLIDLPGGQLAIERISADQLVSGVLSLHGIHPLPLEDRIAAALEQVRPFLQSHGGDVELLAIEENSVRLRLRGACSTCSSSTETLKSSVENAIYQAAPEVSAILTEEMPPAPHSGLVILQVQSSPHRGEYDSSL